MARSSDIVRRTLGAVFIGTAILMLILGETALADALEKSRTTFILYWFGCFVFTALSAFVALLDFVVMRQRIRKQQREFLENTLREIAEKQARSKRDNQNQ
jgi:hypothetical protein